MNSGKYVLTQLLDWIHPQQFHRIRPANPLEETEAGDVCGCD